MYLECICWRRPRGVSTFCIYCIHSYLSVFKGQCIYFVFTSYLRVFSVARRSHVDTVRVFTLYLTVFDVTPPHGPRSAGGLGGRRPNTLNTVKYNQIHNKYNRTTSPAVLAQIRIQIQLKYTSNTVFELARPNTSEYASKKPNTR